MGLDYLIRNFCSKLINVQSDNFAIKKSKYQELVSCYCMDFVCTYILIINFYYLQSCHTATSHEKRKPLECSNSFTEYIFGLTQKLGCFR